MPSACPSSASLNLARGLRLGLPLALAILTFAAYGPIWNADFINLDDAAYVPGNPQVKAGLTPETVWWAWTSFHHNYYIPLTWMSLQLDASLFGPDAGGFHFTNLLLHVANVVLLFEVLARMTRALGRSALVAGLFALHPMHVESVAWVAERKDVLSVFFGLLALLAYGRYVSRQSLRSYLLVLFAFTLSLLAKPMLVTLPCVFLLLDYWPLARWQKVAGSANSSLPGQTLVRLLLEKAPLLLVAFLASFVALESQTLGLGVPTLESWPLGSRLACAITGYEGYLAKTFWPRHLGVFYPVAAEGFLPGDVARASAILLLLTTGAMLAARRCPAFTVGWLWFVGTLFPVSGLLQSGQQHFADRFSYFPHIGLFVALVWPLADLARALRLPLTAQALVATALLGLLAVRTRQQADYWHGSLALWEQTLHATGQNRLAQGTLVSGYLRRGEESLRLGNLAHAEHCLQRAEHFLGFAPVRAAGEEEVDRFQLGQAPADLDYWRGMLRLRQGAWSGAEAHFRGAVDKGAGFNLYRGALAHVLYHAGRSLEAAALYQTILADRPRWALETADRAAALAVLPDRPDPAQAVILARQACEATDFRRPQLLEILAIVLDAAGQGAQAADIARRAVALDPGLRQTLGPILNRIARSTAPGK